MNMTELKEVKANLTSELAYVLKQATSEYPSGTAVSKESTQILCNTIEALFIHGLKAAFFLKKQRSSKYPEPNFWPFVCKYTHKAVLDQIAASNQIKTEVGKSRAWIRILLNENVMDNYLVVLSRDTSTLSKFYEKWAFLRDAERVNILSDYMKGLTRLTLEAPVNSYLLNTWTPTPLILSGLMSGKPARLEQLIKCRQRHGNSFGIVEDAEIAETALEFYDSVEVSTSSDAGGAHVGREDDLSSIYSHPSMLNEGSMSLSVLDQVNSSLVSYPVQESSSLSCGANQIRVTRRTRRCIQHSSKSSSGGSSVSSTNESGSCIDYRDGKRMCEVKNCAESLDGHQTLASIHNTESNEISKETIIISEKNEEPAKWIDNTSVCEDKNSKHLENNSENDAEAFVEVEQSVGKISCDHLYHPQITDEDNNRSDKAKDDIEKTQSSELEQSLSLLDDYHSTDDYSEGNSLLGKGWVIRDNWEFESPEVDSEIIASTTSAQQKLTSDEELQVGSGNHKDLSDEVLIEMLTVIPHEKGLDFQSFRCPSCRKSIGPTFASYSKCSFDEKYYCVDCFDGAGESVIPSRLIHNWDKRSRRVCKNNMIFIESIRDKAVLRIDRINPQLYEHSHALNTVKFLREKLSLSATYLLTCRKSVAEDLESRLWPKDYLYRDIHLYSFSDLLTVLSGHMESHINHLLNFTIKHIQRCLLCAQKGFICEICSSSQVIYPFQLEITTRCLECFSVYHKNCVGQNRCPKCIRRERYSQQRPIFASHCLLFDMD